MLVLTDGKNHVELSEQGVPLAPVPGELTEERAQEAIRRNYHHLDPVPIDGDLTAKEEVGMFRKLSLVNHSMYPNVGRVFFDDVGVVRATKVIEAGTEITDNYVDTCMPHKDRQQRLQSNHGMDDEGPLPEDAPGDLVERLHSRRHEATALLESRATREQGFEELVRVTNEAAECPTQDPAFTDLFAALGRCAMMFGRDEMALQAYAMGMELCSLREEFGLRTVVLTARMAILAKTAKRPEAEPIADLAKQHFEICFGGGEENFKKANPALC
mmetsp:Transcript_13263/g.29488  ORF Transcript_13263/g.29488 Transcript_13263/m.29488 type:complete len:272 (+) Transcript_13263:60-875(+)